MTSAGDGKKRRIIKNPQPKLNPERLMGDKGIQTVEVGCGAYHLKVEPAKKELLLFEVKCFGNNYAYID